MLRHCFEVIVSRASGCSFRTPSSHESSNRCSPITKMSMAWGGALCSCGACGVCVESTIALLNPKSVSGRFVDVMSSESNMSWEPSARL